MIPTEIRNAESLNIFKSKIKLWKPVSCPCRVCNNFIHGVGFCQYYLVNVLLSISLFILIIFIYFIYFVFVYICVFVLIFIVYVSAFLYYIYSFIMDYFK